MKFAVLNIYTPNMKELGVITVEYNKRKYCEKHGYDHLVLRDSSEFSLKHVGYERLAFIIRALKTGKYDWVFWCGTDTMITNYNIKLEDLVGPESDPYCMIIAPDVWDWNSDSMLFRNSPRTIAFLELIISKYDAYIDENGNARANDAVQKDGCRTAWGEQAAMIEECKEKIFSPNIKPEYKDFVKEVPQKTMNSYVYGLYPTPFHAQKKDYLGRDGEWSNGDFLMHWPGTDYRTRVALAINTIKHVIE